MKRLLLIIFSSFLLGNMFGQINTFPHSEGFENGGSIPSGWTNEYVSASVDWTFTGSNQNSGVTARTGSYLAWFYAGNYNGDQTKLVTPAFDLTSLTSPQLTFYYTQVEWSSDQDELRIYYKTSAGGSWMLLDTYTTEVSSWTQVTLSLPSPSADYYIAFDGLSGYGRGVTVDDVEVAEEPTCPDQPSGLTASAETTSGADLTWTTNGSEEVWDLYIIDSNTAPTVASTPTANDITIPYTWTGGTDYTTYYAWVRADCGMNNTDVSEWVGPVNFTTLIGPLSNPSDCQLDIPITDNSCNVTNEWKVDVTTAPGTQLGTDVLLTHVKIIIDHAFDADLDISLISPNNVTVDLSTDNGGSGLDYGDPTDVSCMSVTDFHMDASTNITAGSAPFIGNYVPEGDFADFNDGSNPTGLWTIRICDDFSGDDGTLEFIELVFEAPPTCPNPSALAASNETATGADLAWTENGSATAWDFYISEVNTDPLLATSPTANDQLNPYTWTGGTANTTYYAWVRADCGMDNTDVSGWIGPVSFTTTCSLPAPGNTNASASNVCSGIDFTLSLENATLGTGVSYQWQSSPDNSAWSNIGSAISATLTTSQTTATYYRCNVSCSGEGTTPSTGVQVAMDAPANCYCTGTHSTGGSSDNIAGVVLGTLSNTGTTNGNYTYYDALTVPGLAQGTNASVAVTFGTDGNQYYAVYIDWNQDGDFDDTDETIVQVTSGNQAGSSSTEDITILVPLGATLGQTRMRVRGGDDSPITDPCVFSNSSYGETEDYLVNVTEAPSCPDPSSLAASTETASGADLAWTENGSASAWDLYISEVNTDPLPATSPTANDQLNPYTWTGGTASTTYYAWVRADCGMDNTDVSEWIGPVSFTTLDSCPDPSGLAASNETASGADLAWTENGSATAWDLYISEVNTDPLAGTSPTANDQLNPYSWTGGMANTTYYAWVRADCGKDNTSDISEWVGPISFTTTCGLPAPGNTNASASNVCSGIDFTLSLENTTLGTGVSYQWQSSPDNSAWSDIGSATSATLTTSQTAATYYRCNVSCSGEGTTASTAIEVTMDAPANCYCTVSYTNTTEPITLVNFADINNSSSAATGGDDLEDFTGISSTIYRDASYTITLKGNTDGSFTNYFRVFIDFNQDGIWDGTEAFDCGTINSSTGVDTKQTTATIDIPATALTGSTRMRVSKLFNAYQATACSGGGYGQSEDYILDIEDLVCGENSVYLESNSNSYTLDEPCDDANGWTYYSHPDTPGSYMFAIEWDPNNTGNNNAPKNAATVEIEVGSMISAENGTSAASYGMGRFWNVNGATLVDDVNVRFFYDPAEKTAVEAAATSFANNNSVAENGFSWFKTNGEPFTTSSVTANNFESSMTLLSAANSGTENGVSYVQFDGISSFSGGTGASGAGAGFLPIELVTFDGQAMERGNKLSWISASEENAQAYNIERSLNSRQGWSKIGSVTAVGFSNEQNVYTFMDNAPLKSAYYRLKMIDFDNTFNYSNIIRLERQNDGGSISVYPIPTKDQITVNFTSLKTGMASIVITDITGRQVFKQNMITVKGLQTETVDLNNLQAGVYMLVLETNEERFVQRIVKN